MEVLECIYTDFDELILKGCSSLKELTFIDNRITTLDLSDCDVIEDVDVNSNRLRSITWGNLEALSSLKCTYNYLDTEEDPQIRAAIEAVEEKGHFPTYETQYVDPEASFNETDVAFVQEFLSYEDNESVLGWDKEDVATWEGVSWKTISGVNYIRYFDVASNQVTGSLDIGDLKYIRGLYCGGTKITSLDISGCDKLTTLMCYNAAIETLVFGDNDALNHLDCNYNYLAVEAIEEECEKIAAREDCIQVSYEIQYGDNSRSYYCESELVALEQFLEQGDNADVLNWDMTKPREISQIVWTKEDGIYHAKEIDFWFEDITGSLDLSSFEYLNTVFFGCSEISEVILPNSMTEINADAFCSASKLERVVLPTMLEKIGSEAFFDCSVLKEIQFPESLDQLGYRAFYDCEQLEKAIFLGDSPISVGREIFGNTAPSFCIYHSKDSIGWDTSLWSDYTKKVIGENGNASEVTASPIPTATPKPQTQTNTKKTQTITISPTKSQMITISTGDTKVPNVKIRKCKGKAKKATIVIKKNKKVSGYEVSYRLGKKGKAKVVRTKSWKKNKITLKKLKRKKTYYVQVRAYKVVGGKKYYSTYSKAKKVKVK